MPQFFIDKPSCFSDTEIDDFVAFVTAGGEVTPKDLKDRVLDARSIAFLREGDCLLGVAGLKRPSENHRRVVAAGSGSSVAAVEFPYELGWVFILPSARGRKLSLPLCAPLLEAASGAGVLATSHSTREGMHTTLRKLGFSRSGGVWPSLRNDGDLYLFLRHAV